MSKIPAESGAKTAAVFAGNLAAQAKEHGGSAIWRTASYPPLSELSALADRLRDIACILHEIAHDDTPAAITAMVKAARKGVMEKAIRSAGSHCRSLAEKRFRERLRGLEKALRERGWAVKCWTRTIDENDSIYWPPMEVAILVKIRDFVTDAGYIEACLSVGQERLGQDWRFRIVPTINGQVVPELALLPSSQMLLPDLNFAQEWRPHINLPFLSSELSEAFDAAITACTQISAIINCRALTHLHSEEEDVLSRVIEMFKRNREIVAASAETAGLEEFNEALAYLDKTFDQIVDEIEAAKSGKTSEIPFCMNTYHAISGEENEKVNELAAIKIILRQAECRRIAFHAK